MAGKEIASKVMERTGFPTEAWETGAHWTIVIRVDDDREAWGEPSGFWSVHLRRRSDGVPYASQPTDVPETVDDPEEIAAGIHAALDRLLGEASETQVD